MTHHPNMCAAVLLLCPAGKTFGSAASVQGVSVVQAGNGQQANHHGPSSKHVLFCCCFALQARPLAVLAACRVSAWCRQATASRLALKSAAGLTAKLLPLLLCYSVLDAVESRKWPASKPQY
jgi:hypothetical protein